MFWIKINRSSKTTLTKQIFEQLRDRILRNELKSGEKLLSTRNLSQELGVSRNIILEVYDQLTAEGYLESREGSGTYVAENTSLPGYKASADYSSRLLTQKEAENNIIDFNSGIPDLKKFPRNLWAKFLRLSMLDMPEQLLDYGECRGFFDLRLTLSTFLLKTKGIRCRPEQIIILSGSSEGFLILGQLFKSGYESVLIEDPIYNGIQNILRNFKFKFHPVPVDDKGIITDLLPEDIKDFFITVTPSHQFPTGSVLPIQRRVKLIELAKNKNTCIIENDYDSEFRHTGHPISSLHLLAPELVIHIGTFSESMYPSIRLAYMVLPENMAEECCKIKTSLGLFTPAVYQPALSNFIKEGYFQRHVNRMKKLYNLKRKALISILEQEFRLQIKISGDSTGLYIVAEFHDTTFTDDIIKKFIACGVRVYRVEDHSIIKGRHCNKLILGYGNLTSEQIKVGIGRIKKILT